MTDVVAPAPPTATPAISQAWHALLHGVGLADRSAAGRLRITGPDALDLLNRLSTNKLESLPDGQTRLTVLTDENARVVDLLALGAQEGGWWCQTSPGRQVAVVEWLDRYTFGEQITVRDETAATAQLTLAGPGVARVLGALGLAAPAPGRLASATWGATRLTLWAGPVDGAVDVIMQAGDEPAVLAALVGAGAAPVPEAVWEAYRIMRGVPAYGAEFGLDTNPLESRLRGAISDDKGCYTGQEVIARLLTYHKVQRRLMALALSGPGVDAVLVGAELVVEGQRAGRITSVAALPDGRRAGLALVHMRFALPGHAVAVAGADAVAALTDPAFALATEPAPA